MLKEISKYMKNCIKNREIMESAIIGKVEHYNVAVT